MLAKSQVGAYAKDLGYENAEDVVIESTQLGKTLAGIRYERLFDYYADAEKFEIANAWQVLVGDYVADNEGTGIVHQAPAYGEDDQNL